MFWITLKKRKTQNASPRQKENISKSTMFAFLSENTNAKVLYAAQLGHSPTALYRGAPPPVY